MNKNPDINISLNKTYNLFDEILKRELIKEEHLHYKIVCSYYDIALACSKKMQLSKAAFFFSKGDAISRGNSIYKQVISNKTKRWISVYALPKKAYYYYKKKDFRTSTLLTYKSISMFRNFYLEGNHIEIFGEIQQYHNLSRLYLNTNRNVAKGLSICVELLKLLCLGYATITESVIRYPNELTKSDIDELRTLFVLQVLNETLFTLFRLFQNQQEKLMYYLAFLLTPIYVLSDQFPDNIFLNRLRWLSFFKIILSNEKIHYNVTDLSIYNYPKQDVQVLKLYINNLM
jgi:hypothetical protein